MSQHQMKSIHAEEAVVSMMMVDKFSRNEGIAHLTAKDFTDEKLSLLFTTIVGMVHIGQEIDVVTIVEQLKSKGQLELAGGFDQINNLIQSVATTENVSSYINIVSESALARRFIMATEKAAMLIKNGEGSIRDRVYSAEKEILAVSRGIVQGGFMNSENFIKQTQVNLAKRLKSNTKYTGLQTGFSAFDSMTAGLQKSDYIVLAARPSMGKTAFALNLFTQIAEKNKKSVAFFSLEMPTEHIVNRMLATRGQVNLSSIKSPITMTDKEKSRLDVAADEIARLPLYINDTPGLTIGKLVSSARKLHADTNQELGCIIIDYLTLVQSSKSYNSYVQEVGKISSQLKQLARELEIPVIVLSQLSRKVEQRDNKTPMMSDLRESGTIEQDADIVMFLYREGYYNKEKSEDGTTKVIISKHRNGPTGVFTVMFDKTTGKFNG